MKMELSSSVLRRLLRDVVERERILYPWLIAALQQRRFQGNIENNVTYLCPCFLLIHVASSVRFSYLRLAFWSMVFHCLMVSAPSQRARKYELAWRLRAHSRVRRDVDGLRTWVVDGAETGTRFSDFRKQVRRQISGLTPIAFPVDLLLTSGPKLSAKL